MNDHHLGPHSNDAKDRENAALMALEASQAQRQELTRLRAIEVAAQTVSLAAWTDRHSRLHGHPAVKALDVALKS